MKMPSGKKPGGGGHWLWMAAAIFVVIAVWWVIYKPFQTNSSLLPPTAGVTNRVPQVITNAANSIRGGLTNIMPPSLLPPAQPAPVTTNAIPVPRSPTNSPVMTNAVAAPVTNSVPTPAPAPAPSYAARHPQNDFEIQLALDRMSLSPGSMDGVIGSQTRAAIAAFQRRERLPPTGQADATTMARLWLVPPVYVTYTITVSDVGALRTTSKTWLGKSQQDHLGYESILEMAAEKGHAYPAYIRSINPGVDWATVTAGTRITIPNASRTVARMRASYVRIRLNDRVLQAFDQEDKLLVHYPVSIAQFVEKRPLGELKVAVGAEDPNYRFNPEIFPESAEARQLNRTLIIPPGPNNPVGVAWIGLDRPGYGIHGTPSPEAVGRTESHGCFRLANWNAAQLLKLSWKGMPVFVEH